MQNTHKQSSGADQKQLPGLPGKRTWTSWALLPVLGLAAATLTSCAGKYTGSGSIPSVAGAPNQATLAFNVQTDGDTDGDGVAENVKGQIQFQDLAAGVRIHGEILNSGTLPEGPIYIDGEEWPAGTILLEGAYTSQPPGKGGIFNIAVCSPQTPGNQGGGEQLLIILYGAEDAYYNFGLVSGGNMGATAKSCKSQVITLTPGSPGFP